MKFNELVKKDKIPSKTQIFGAQQPPEDHEIKRLKKNFDIVRNIYSFDRKFLI